MLVKRGSRGAEVEALQRKLLAKGINAGPVGGIFEPKTEDAVKRFQERCGLQADGIAGPKARAAFESSEMPAPKKAAGPAPKGQQGKVTPKGP
ncbi:MAG: peptidoglycan-binding domain-containing protein [Actinomycetota bacterium]